MERLPITLLSREVIAALEMLKYENNWGGGEIAVVGFGAEHLLKKNTDVCLKNDHYPNSEGFVFDRYD